MLISILFYTKKGDRTRLRQRHLLDIGRAGFQIEPSRMKKTKKQGLLLKGEGIKSQKILSEI